MISRRTVFVLLPLALLCLPVTELWGQTSSVSGTITDPAGAPVSEAKVLLKSDLTGAVRTSSSAGSGTYTIPDVTPGRYQMEVTKPGFAKALYKGIELTVGESFSLNPQLEIGAITQSIEVSGNTLAPVELDNAQISNVVDSRRIVGLPLLTRDPYSLILLSPGVVQTNSALGGFAVNGSRERNNNFLFDGVDNNDTSVPGSPSGLAGLNPESTQEFRVITNSFLPEYGRNTGAIVDVISRSGTNSVHGNAYWFGRYSALAARDFFNTRPDPQDPFVRNDFGWSLGGPIKKDRTFFFVNSEYQRFRTTLTEASIVPTAAFKSGVFTFAGQSINLRDPGSANNVLHLPLDPTIQKALALLPNPNGEPVDDVRGVYRFPSASKNNNATVNFKLDHRFSENENFFVRYAYTGLNDPNPFHDDFAPGLGSIGVDQQFHSIAANLISSLRPTLVNEFRVGINRPSSHFGCGGVTQFDALHPADSLGNGSDFALSGIPGIGCTTLGSTSNEVRRTGTWSLTDGLSWVKDKHSFKFGGEFRYVFENGYDAFASRTLYSFNAYTVLSQPIVNVTPGRPCNFRTNAGCGSVQLQNLASGLLGFVAEQTQSQFFDKSGNRSPVDYYKFVQHEYAAYLQDNWKLLPNLTLTYGLRYQFNGVPFERDGRLSNLFSDPAGFAPFTFSMIGSGSAKNFFNNDPLNFEPRVGFSWDPFSKGHTAVRGGFGIFHDRLFGNLFENATGNPPFNESVQIFPQTADGNFGDILPNVGAPATFPPSAVVTEGSYLAAVIIDKNLKIPVSQNWNLGVQQELPGHATLDLNYVGSKGGRELRVVNGNPPIPSLVNQLIASGTPPAALQGTALFRRFSTTNNSSLLEPSLIKSIGNSTYHAFQANFNRRFDHGMQIQGAYTWSHSIDDASDPLKAGLNNRSFPRNSLNLREERGASDFDMRQRLVINYLLDLPFGKGRAYASRGVVGRVLEGWQFAGITLFQDGLPYDVFGNVDTEHTGFTSRADVVGNTAIPAGSDRTRTGPLPKAFAIAPFGRGGNVGRNSFAGPGTINTDLVLSKAQTLTERLSGQLRFEFYNLFNRVQFSQPGNAISNPGTFGVSTATVTRPDGTSSNRQIQLALKLIF